MGAERAPLGRNLRPSPYQTLWEAYRPELSIKHPIPLLPWDGSPLPVTFTLSPNSPLPSPLPLPVTFTFTLGWVHLYLYLYPGMNPPLPLPSSPLPWTLTGKGATYLCHPGGEHEHPLQLWSPANARTPVCALITAMRSPKNCGLNYSYAMVFKASPHHSNAGTPGTFAYWLP